MELTKSEKMLIDVGLEYLSGESRKKFIYTIFEKRISSEKYANELISLHRELDILIDVLSQVEIIKTKNIKERLQQICIVLAKKREEVGSI